MKTHLAVVVLLLSVATAAPAAAQPRTPNPRPGQLLPVPAYGRDVVVEMARQFPGELANACDSRAWLFRLVHALRQRDTRWGLNYKRGHRGDLSTDIVTYNPTDRPDEGESQVYLFDVIGAICERNDAAFSDVTAATWGASGHPACGTLWCAMWTIEPLGNPGGGSGPPPPPPPAGLLEKVQQILERLTAVETAFSEHREFDRAVWESVGGTSVLAREIRDIADRTERRIAVLESRPTPAIEWPEYVGRVGPATVVLKPRKK